MSDISIKQGDSLLLTFTFFNNDGTSVDLTSVTLSGQVRDSADNLVATLAIATTSILNVATLQVADTTQWPLGLLRADIRAVSAGLTEMSETFAIRVGRRITQ
jgi:hypothetical protein